MWKYNGNGLDSWSVHIQPEELSGGNTGPRPLGPKEIDGLRVLPGKAYSLLTGHLITGEPLESESAPEMWFQGIHILSLCDLLG